MDEEIKDTVIEAETEIKEDQKEAPKGEDIYVENDPRDLERMLGIAPSDMDEDDTDESENEESDDIEESEGIEEKEEIEEVEEMVEETKPILLSDFMYEDKDAFTYLSHDAGSYQVLSIPMDDKKGIRQAVKSSAYIFRYPKFLLKDKVLGFTQTAETTDILYKVFFPEYSLSFKVDDNYMKSSYSESFKEYFEDLVTRTRPKDIVIEKYKSSITINSLKVIETGILEVSTDKGTKHLLLKNPNVSFHCILDYIRELSDQGEETLTLKLLPEFFVEI